MVRTQIQLTEEQARRLRAMSAEQGVSMAELIRRSVDALLNGGSPDRSAEWRLAMDSLLDSVDASAGADGSLRVARASLAGYDAESLRILWPALAARANVVMDRRGTHRAAEFTMNGMTGRSIQLSGMFEIVMHRDHLLLRRWGGAQRTIA